MLQILFSLGFTVLFFWFQDSSFVENYQSAFTGVFYVVLSVTSLLLPQYKDMVANSPIALPIELGEVAFMLWLLIIGAKVKPAKSAVNQT